ncbi:uncharacterized protein ASCRUDRAFT_74308 [Ascoidea rubescens DSM 1968]|uniref:Uncharacterized protein n=1 Tax=Ascoidea rubescens DSM 1968 TaxID=1344418 RepID=A0A1D2VML0_9ASCO|nr:hypothetical protein ASCRUDRAFT_74308 [Ascoidea rubescens DSM 1968]ODV62851.1 hypothetical protein ASCRUDRAFT_74308 [Ascoidea rubescens DSM 1968]
MSMLLSSQLGFYDIKGVIIMDKTNGDLFSSVGKFFHGRDPQLDARYVFRVLNYKIQKNLKVFTSDGFGFLLYCNCVVYLFCDRFSRNILVAFAENTPANLEILDDFKDPDAPFFPITSTDCHPNPEANLISTSTSAFILHSN